MWDSKRRTPQAVRREADARTRSQTTDSAPTPRRHRGRQSRHWGARTRRAVARRRTRRYDDASVPQDAVAAEPPQRIAGISHSLCHYPGPGTAGDVTLFHESPVDPVVGSVECAEV